MKVLAFGMNGFVGSRVARVLGGQFTFDIVSRSTGVDITHVQSVMDRVDSSDADIIFNFSGKANVDACEQDKDLAQQGEAWRVNVDGVQHLVQACQKYNKKLLHISTDFVFDGTKGNYTEEDAMHPINWYGVTKAKGDEIILQAGIPFVILRPAFPYTFLDIQKHFVAAMFSRLSAGQPIAGVTDETFTPTWIDDMAKAITLVIANNLTGVFHIGGATSVTPHAVALQIAQTFGLDTSLISETTREKYFAGKAKRPFNTSLNNDKIEKLGLRITSFEEGLAEIKMQNSKSKNTI